MPRTFPAVGPTDARHDPADQEDAGCSLERRHGIVRFAETAPGHCHPDKNFIHEVYDDRHISAKVGPFTHGSAPRTGAFCAMRSHDLGRHSEDLACAFLRDHGWHILERNYRAGHKEIDIIARRNRTIAFIEVKARAGDAWGHPLEAITWAKRREIAYVARAWIRLNPMPGHEFRFDAIAITWRRRTHILEHVENAWTIR